MTIDEISYHVSPCISGFRVFGKSQGKCPAKVSQVRINALSELDVELEWDGMDAVGYVAMWGYAQEKLYHSRMVYGKTGVKLGALMKGEPVYIRVDAFNECGVTEGYVVQLR